jgi:hypothetical protein
VFPLSVKERKMEGNIVVEIVGSKQVLDRPKLSGTARLWVGESDEGQIQIAFLGPGPDGAPLLTAGADKAADQFHRAYIMQALMNGDDSAETQIHETRRFWAELMACPESWEGLAAAVPTTGTATVEGVPAD